MTNAVPYLQQVLATGQCSALVTQNADGTLTMCIDIGPGLGSLYIPILEGAEGVAGEAQFPLIPMPDEFDTPADLPSSPPLTNSSADYGKFWIIAQSDDDENPLSVGAYIWYGTNYSPSGYRFLPFGSQGIPGYYGVMKPSVSLLGPEGLSQQLAATGAGTAASPWTVPLELAIPEGPFGNACPIYDYYDVAIDSAPIVGEYLTYTGTHTGTFNYRGSEVNLPIWQPTSVGNDIPGPYTVPQSAFIHRLGITFGDDSPSPLICAFTIPAQPFPYKPVVLGQIRMFEITLGTSPSNIFMMGVEVRLDSTTGQLIARGFGNTISGVTRIFPHTSSPGADASVEMTPSNDVGLVDQGDIATIYVNIVNDGLVTIYDYVPSDAQLFVYCVPATLGS
jgi:hypothetical protein